MSNDGKNYFELVQYVIVTRFCSKQNFAFDSDSAWVKCMYDCGYVLYVCVFIFFQWWWFHLTLDFSIKASYTCVRTEIFHFHKSLLMMVFGMIEKRHALTHWQVSPLCLFLVYSFVGIFCCGYTGIHIFIVFSYIIVVWCFRDVGFRLWYLNKDYGTVFVALYTYIYVYSILFMYRYRET